MAVRQEGQIFRFIGLSTDDKPTTAIVPGATPAIPPGSTYLEADTGRLWRFLGGHWYAIPAEESLQGLLTAIYIELTHMRTVMDIVNEFEVNGETSE